MPHKHRADIWCEHAREKRSRTFGQKPYDVCEKEKVPFANLKMVPRTPEGLADHDAAAFEEAKLVQQRETQFILQQATGSVAIGV